MNVNDVVEIEGVKIKIEDLFKAPEKDGAVVSVRVHRSVKEALMRLAEKEGLHGVSELIRYLIAGFLMGKYGIVKPDPKILAPPIYLNVQVNVNKRSETRTQEYVDDMKVLELKREIEETLRETYDLIDKIRLKLVKVQGNDYIRKLKHRLFKLLTKAVRYNLENEIMAIRNAFVELNKVVDNAIY